MRELVERLSRALGADRVALGASAGQRTDWVGHVGGEVLAAVHPQTTDEVALMLRMAAESATPVQVQGGNTGLVGGGIPPSRDGVGDPLPLLLCTDRLTGISDTDPVTGQLTARAGTTVADVQRAAESMGWVYGVDLAARDSATIGGTVATNAGGIRVCAYGTTRAQVVGVEAVLADGSVVSDLRGFAKDNTGYNLVGLLCGSEGTLAIVTAVRLRLWRPPPPSTLVALPVEGLGEAAGLAAAAAAPGVQLLAAEVVDADSWQAAAREADAADPLRGAAGGYVLLVEVGDGGDASGFTDAVTGRPRVAVATQASEKRALWRLREGQTDYWAAKGGALHKYDVTLPPDALDTFVASARGMAADLGGELGVFGHIRECNLHVQLSLPAAPAMADSAAAPGNGARCYGWHRVGRRTGGPGGCTRGGAQLRRATNRSGRRVAPHRGRQRIGRDGGWHRPHRGGRRIGRDGGWHRPHRGGNGRSPRPRCARPHGTGPDPRGGTRRVDLRRARNGAGQGPLPAPAARSRGDRCDAGDQGRARPAGHPEPRGHLPLTMAMAGKPPSAPPPA